MALVRPYGPNTWALILGASSGFGGACAVELARRGMNIFAVHLDRQATMPAVDRIVRDVRHTGSKIVLYNINAADAIKRSETLDDIRERFGHDSSNTVRVLLHSLAFGTLKPFITTRKEEGITQAQMEMTLDVMAHSLVYWTQGLIAHGLMKHGGRIFCLTSSGSHSVLPSYGAISAAKAAIESHVRQLAMELGPAGITVNSILAGVTDTPALRKIPGSQHMLQIARAKNPQGRATSPEDIARAIALLSQDEANFVSGNVIGVDGGEDKVNYIGQKHPSQID